MRITQCEKIGEQGVEKNSYCDKKPQPPGNF